MEEWNNRKESKAKEWEARQFEPKTVNQTKNKTEKQAMGLSLWIELFYGAIHLFEYAAYKSTEIHTKF